MCIRCEEKRVGGLGDWGGMMLWFVWLRVTGEKVMRRYSKQERKKES